MSSHAFIQDMAVVTIVAAGSMLLFQRARLSAVLGYILAGVIIGPYTPLALLLDATVVNVLGQLGIVFLLFAVGLEFNVGKLREVGASTVLAAIIQAGLILWVGYLLGRAFAFSHLESLFLGAIISVSSTAIIVTILKETGQRDTTWANVVMGITLIEDIIAVIVLTILTAASGGGEGVGVGTLLLRLGLFLAAALVLGPLLVPRAVDWVARRAGDALVLVSVGLAFGLALLASYLGFSTALGAFVMGALVGESKNARRVAERSAPLRDLFAAIFFVTVGMLFDPRLLLSNWALIVIIAGALLAAKVALAAGATFLTGRAPGQSIRIGMALVPLGEFSFVLAAAAGALGTQAPLYAIAVGVSAITALAAPFFVRGAPRVVRYYDDHAPIALRTYASLYGAWLRRMKALAEQDPRRKLSTRLGTKTFLYAAASIALLAGGAFLVDRLGSAATGAVGLQGVTGVTVLAAGWVVVAAVTAPFLLLWWNALREFVGSLAVVSSSTPGDANGGAVLQRTFLLVGAVVFGAVVVVATSPFLPSGAVFAAVVLLVGIVTMLLLRSLTRLQARVDAEVTRVLTGEGARSQSVAAAVQHAYPWEVEVREVGIPQGGMNANRTLRDLHLRNRTGASVVAIHRGDDHIMNPAPDAVLLAGDRVALAGETDQLDRAEELLSRKARTDGDVGVAADLTRWRETPLHAGSPLVGLSLAGARIRERAGATVVGVLRDGERLLHPSPSFRLAADDVLLVVGNEDQVRSVEALARGEG
jgi:CPA2 family monovalent cation:H+ antiporter-2